MSSIYGKNLKVTLFGESHGPAIGCVIDGFPANFTPDLEKVKAFMARRAPGSQPGSTARCESDAFEILSGIFNGKTCGTPIAAVIRNSDAHSKDYSKLSDLMRPGHADYPTQLGASNHSDVEREINDFYATDPNSLVIFLKALEKDGIKLHKDVWEPSCGMGHLTKVLEQAGYNVYSSDLINRGYGETGIDFLRTQTANGCDILTNRLTNMRKNL